MSKFKRVNFIKTIKSQIKDNETLMSFYTIEENIFFNKWWNLHGSEVFNKWLQNNKNKRECMKESESTDISDISTDLNKKINADKKLNEISERHEGFEALNILK